MRDLLGVEPTLPADAPKDSRLEGFDNNRAALALSAAHLTFYAKMGAALAERVLPTGNAKPAFLGCEVTGTGRAACLEAMIEGFGRRVFRRPLDADEKSSYLALAKIAEPDPDPLAAFRVVLSAFLQSPSFLFRVEVGETVAGSTRRRLTGYEVATRLAYLLWGTGPTAELLDRAQKRELDDAAGVANVAKAMLADARAREGLARFTTQMVHLYDLDGETRDAATYPLWARGLREAMAEETRRLLDALAFEDGVSFTGIFDASFTFVNAVLAEHYGLPAPKTTWERVSLGGRDDRGGLLTHASVLTMTGHTEITAPIARGAFVRDVLLCDPLPPPPEGVPPAPEDRDGKSVREILAAHGKSGCVECHVKLDPTGFGLERYDLVGAYRTQDEAGRSLTGAGRLDGAEDPEFVGGVALGQKLAGMPQARSCLMKHVFRYGFGRHETDEDACALAAFEKAFTDAHGDLRATLVSVAASPLFREIGGAR